MSIFHKIVPTIIIGLGFSVIIGKTLSPSHEVNTAQKQPADVKMDYKNVQPWLDSIKSLPKDQQRAKLVKAIESQLAVTLYRAQRVLDEKADSTGSQKDEMVISILKELHEQCAQQLQILKKALAALDK